MSISDKQFLAKILFTREHLDQKIVAVKVGVSERTMSDWVNKFNWKDLRRRLLVSKEDVLANLYEQMEEVNEFIRSKEKGKRYADTRESDILVKLTASIRNMETELAIADIVGSGTRFLKFAQTSGMPLEMVKEFAEYWNAFIQDQIKR
jgi:hypothetical protein